VLLRERLALLVAAEERNPQGEGVTLHDLANIELDRGRFPAALELFRESIECKRRGDTPRDLATTLLVCARWESFAGDLERAHANADDAAELLRGLYDQRTHPGVARAEATPDGAKAVADVRRLLGRCSPSAAAQLERHRSLWLEGSRDIPSLGPVLAWTGPAMDELDTHGLVEPVGGGVAARLTDDGRGAARRLVAEGDPAADVEARDPRASLADALSCLGHGDLAAAAAALAPLRDMVEQPGDEANAGDVATAAGLLALVYAALGRDREAEGVRGGPLVSVLATALAGADVATVVQAGVGCVDADDLAGAHRAFEHAGATLGAPDRADAALTSQLGLAWRWLGLAHEATGDSAPALAAYNRAGDWLVGAPRRIVSLEIVDLLRARGDQEAVAGYAWVPREAPTVGAEERRYASWMRLSRVLALLGRRAEARGAVAWAAEQLADMPTHRGRVPADLSSDSGSAADCSPSAIALLERYRAHEAQSRVVHAPPARRCELAGPSTIVAAVGELERAGLLERTLPTGWTRLSARGRSAARGLLPDDLADSDFTRWAATTRSDAPSRAD
jgi:tetratricopeptide (TPR) repeat protein